MVQTVTAALRRISYDNPTHWFKHVTRLQQAINSTCHRSTSYTPFKLMFGVEMRKSQDLDILKALEEVEREIFEERREELRENAKRAIANVQEENIRNFNRKRKPAWKYKVNDIIAIKQTQFGTKNKLFPKFLGPYKIVCVKGNDRYDVERVGEGDGPKVTSTSADNMKLWKVMDDSDVSESESSESDDIQDGRVVGLDDDHRQPFKPLDKVCKVKGKGRRRRAHGRESVANKISTKTHVK